MTNILSSTNPKPARKTSTVAHDIGIILAFILMLAGCSALFLLIGLLLFIADVGLGYWQAVSLVGAAVLTIWVGVALGSRK